MARDHQLSIRARLTLIFVLAIAVILTFTGVALVNLVHRSLLNQASNQIDAVMEQTQERFATATVSSKRVLVLATVGHVVVQATNTSDTKVWAASSAIGAAPGMAAPVSDGESASALSFQFIRNAGFETTLRPPRSTLVSSTTPSR